MICVCVCVCVCVRPCVPIEICETDRQCKNFFASSSYARPCDVVDFGLAHFSMDRKIHSLEYVPGDAQMLCKEGNYQSSRQDPKNMSKLSHHFRDAMIRHMILRALCSSLKPLSPPQPQTRNSHYSAD